jgi:hypothetical protein
MLHINTTYVTKQNVRQTDGGGRLQRISGIDK